MNHTQLNDLALRVDARKGVIDKEDLMKLCDVAQVDYLKTFQGMTELEGAVINKVISLAHNKITRDDIKKANTVVVTGTDEYNTKQLEKLLKANEPIETDNQRYDRISTEMWKSRKSNKESK